MRVPLSWLVSHVALPEADEASNAEHIADALVRVGLEVESIEPLGPVTGPLVVGRVLESEELTGVNKPIRKCRVDVGEAEPVGIICGATNFDTDDLVVVARPGAVLPGDFEIAARKAYGHISDGMMCSAAELRLGTDHSGILVLPLGTARPGENATDLLGMGDTVIELAITPDRGYCFSIRGLARELACAYDVPYGDPAVVDLPEADADAWAVDVADSRACRRFTLRRVSGIDPAAESPWWMQWRLQLAGVRPISLAVDVTNYVMLELGQPLHAFDAQRLDGALVVRRASAGEKLTTLDGVDRELDPDDIVICDDTGPVSLAGVMGGAGTEIGENASDLLIEAANWDPAIIARSARRHKLPSEAARRFERAVDPMLGPAAAEMAVQLLVRYGGGAVEAGRTDEGDPVSPAAITMPLDLPDRVAGVRHERGVNVRRLTQIGCQVDVTAGDAAPGLSVSPPSWRPDLCQPADLVEEVLRLEGYDAIPSELIAAPAGRGLSPAQRRRRSVSRTLAAAGLIEVLPAPFVASAMWDDLGLDQDDPRRSTLAVVNPLESDRDQLATTLLPGLLDALSRNVARGQRDVALYGIGQVVRPGDGLAPMPDPGVSGRPTTRELQGLFDALPDQPQHVGAVFTGRWERPGWWGPGRAATWADAVGTARLIGQVSGVELEPRNVEHAPWHPGRCAQFRIGERVVGHAGELHPAVVEALGLPARTSALELNLDAIPITDERPSPRISPYPPVLQDVALVVDEALPAGQLAQTLRSGAGELLEDLRLFDAYTGEKLGAGKRSLAFALRFRAPDRTLTEDEASAAREAAVAAASEAHGAELRS